MQSANKAEGSAQRSSIASGKPKKSGFHVHRLSERTGGIAYTSCFGTSGTVNTHIPARAGSVPNGDTHRLAVGPMNTACQGNKKEVPQHWRPPGRCVQRAPCQQGETSLVGTPGKTQSPMSMKRKAAAATSAYICHPVPLEIAFTSPAMPEDLERAEDNQDFRATPPSMRSPDLSIQQKLKIPMNQDHASVARRWDAHGIAGVMDYCHQDVLPRTGTMTLADPVRVPTVPDERGATGDSPLGISHAEAFFCADMNNVHVPREATCVPRLATQKVLLDI